MNTDFYGDHATIYKNISEIELYSKFREEVFNHLNINEKQQLYQEVLNRNSVDLKMHGSPVIHMTELSDGDIAQTHSGGVILLNNTTNISPISILETLFHENQHCLQDQLLSGIIPVTSENQQLFNEYAANNFTVSQLQNGNYGVHYLYGLCESDYLYAVQPCERDAFIVSEEKTTAVIYQLSEKFGTEHSFEEYISNLEVNGYQAILERGIEYYNDENLAQSISAVLQNAYYNDIQLEVNPDVEVAVHNEMSASYESLYSDNVLDISINEIDESVNEECEDIGIDF